MLRINCDFIDYEPEHARVLYNGKLFTGIIFELHPDGWLWCEEYCVDGYYQGLSLSYFQSGRVKTESYKLFNTLHGTEREWNIEGNLIRQTFALLGSKINEKIWDNRGELVSEYILKEDNFNYKLLEKENIIFPLNKHLLARSLS